MRNQEVERAVEPVRQSEFVLSRRSTRFRIMRHGQSEANKPGQLHVISPPLSDFGKIQATAAGIRYIKAASFASEIDKDLPENLRGQGLSFTRIFHSGNKIRAQETAERILDVLPYDIPVHTDIRLTEQLEGYSPAYVGDQTVDLKRRFDERVHGMSAAERWVYDGRDVEGLDLDHYETPEQAAQRYKEALLDIAITYEGEDILIIGHAFIMRDFLVSQTREKNITSGADFDKFAFDNTGYFDLEFYRDGQGKMQIRVADLHLEAVT